MDQASFAAEILHGSELEYFIVERIARGSLFAFLFPPTIQHDFAHESGRSRTEG
jgi:hypothetical protein